MKTFKRMIAATVIAVLGFGGFAMSSPNLPSADAAVHNWWNDELLFVNSSGNDTAYRVNTGTSKLSKKVGTGNWKGFTSVTAIDVTGDGKDELLFYNSNTGVWSLWNVNSKGQPAGAAIRTGKWTKGWTAIVAANVHSDANDEVIFYNSKTGQYNVYNIKANGTLGSAMTSTKISKGWSLIFGYDINASVERLGFYNSKTGEFAIYQPSSKGKLGSKKGKGNWGKGWTNIVNGEFDRDLNDELVMYNASSRRYQVASLHKDSILSIVNSGKWSAWKHILAIQIDPAPKYGKPSNAKPSIGSGSYRDRIAGILKKYGCADSSIKIDDKKVLGKNSGVADWYNNTIHIKSGLGSRLLYVAAHECAHMIQYRVFAGNVDELQNRMNRIYGGSGFSGLEQNADCITHHWGIIEYHYTNSCKGSRTAAAAAVASGKKP